MTTPPRRLLAGLAAVCTLAAVALGSMSGAAAREGEGVISSFASTVTVERDGSLTVVETMQYDLGALSSEQLQVERSLLTREHYDDEDDRVYDVHDVTVEVDGEQATPEVESADGRDTYRFDISGAAPKVEWSYQVDGAVAETSDGLEVRWPVVQGFDWPITSVEVSWNAPGALWLSCLAGPAGSSKPCTTSQLVEVSAPTMTQLDLAAGDQVVGILGLSRESGVAANADFETRWSLARSFSATGAPLAVALGLLALGLLASFLLWWTRGRDVAGDAADFEPPVVDAGEGRWVFAPPSAIRPGQMGTLVDERADVIDVAATVVDLATRNYLFIEEIERGAYGRMDWMLRRRNDAGDELLGYEREIFEAIFATAGEVMVSDLPSLLRARLGGVQGLMYADMVDQGWFAERPDSVRGRWTTAGWVLVVAGVVLTVVLALVSTFGLAGLAVVLGGAALAGSGQIAPARTAKGSRLLPQLRSFAAWLETADISDLPADAREQLVSRLYPYALVFGSGERWAQALADLDDDPDPDEPLYWYGAPTDWHLSDAAPSLGNLAATLTSALGSRRLLSD